MPPKRSSSKDSRDGRRPSKEIAADVGELGDAFRFRAAGGRGAVADKGGKKGGEQDGEPPLGESSRLARKYPHLDFYEVKYIVKLFYDADVNKSGGLDKAELGGILHKLFELPASSPVPDKLLTDNWSKMSSGEGGEEEVSMDAFLEWYQANMFSMDVRELDRSTGETMAYDLAKKLGVEVLTIDKIKKRFDSFDLDNSGTIDFDEYMQMLVYILKAGSKEDISETTVLRFWQEIDSDSSGEISFTEFAQWYVKYFNPDDEEMDMSLGPVHTFYESFNPMNKRTPSKDLLPATEAAAE